ncbi:helix-turn-helix domain-containing protein [Kutzneria chonburiensis]|uniref:Helix-turn-helix domain-containing protein n=1 Tax=Kutzneria chonburiensis TaxID=1483604 RepID=A0ABV6NA76_9PSEU|nr:helix-turn-helix transcriptional regulator [Kutzneria chonburiensis]
MNRLGEYLRARREATRPDDVGIAGGGRRRSPGLRREEVAALCGLSTDYYARLEQGRERNPSDQVLTALARVFRLDEEASAYLQRLARPRGARRRTEKVSPQLALLLESWTDRPAMVLGPRLDILAVNVLGTALFNVLGAERNLVRFAFLDPAAREFYRDWDSIARSSVAALRAASDLEDDPAFIGELVVRSQEFSRLWARHDVRGKTQEAKRLRHPDVGDIDVTYQSFSVNGSAGQQLVVYQAEAGSPSAERIALLGSLCITPTEAGPRQSRRPAEDQLQ